MHKHYSVVVKVWIYPGVAAWHFVTIPPKITKDIDYYFSHVKKGWGSLPVSVTVGNTTWKTSIFPDKKLDSYLLPIKAAVRKSENIKEDDTIRCTIAIAD